MISPIVGTWSEGRGHARGVRSMSCSMVWLYAAMQVAHSAMRSDLVYRVLGYAEFRNTFILLLFPRWCAKPRGGEVQERGDWSQLGLLDSTESAPDSH